MIECKFELNGKELSDVVCGANTSPAYSGRARFVNRRVTACIPGVAAIPPGQYCIFDRQSGGMMGGLRELFSDRGEWFALYAIDGKIDDETCCERFKRGQFRLHPEGPLGISQGCIVIKKPRDDQVLYSRLKNARRVTVPGAGWEAFGKVFVK